MRADPQAGGSQHGAGNRRPDCGLEPPLASTGMMPVLTPDEMAAVDAAAPEPVEVLIGRAGAAVAREALDLLGGAYGRRVVVVAGKGNNGADGRAAARRLRRRGVRVEVIDAADAPAAAAGRRPGDRRRLRHRLPGRVHGPRSRRRAGAGRRHPERRRRAHRRRPADGRLAAVRTVTFAALKPGLLLEPGRALAGEVIVADIGLDCRAPGPAWSRPPTSPRGCRRARRDAHKWRAAVVVVAGSPGMTGAAHLAARAAQRAGAGMVRVALARARATTPACPPRRWARVPAAGWAAVVLEELARVGALVIGPGLGRGGPGRGRRPPRGGRAPRCPWWSTATGCTALGDAGGRVLARRGHGDADRADPPRRRVRAPRRRASGPRPHRRRPRPGGRRRGRRAAQGPDHRRGRTRRAGAAVDTAGDARLATAGTGDVLTGIDRRPARPGARTPLDAAAAGAWLHGRAAPEGPARGLVASDVVEGFPAALAAVSCDGRRRGSLVAPRVGRGRPRRHRGTTSARSARDRRAGPAVRGGEGQRLRPRRRRRRPRPRSRPAPTGWPWPRSTRPVALRDAGIEAPLLLLSEPRARRGRRRHRHRRPAHRLQPCDHRHAWPVGAVAAAGPVAVHLKVDTGMHRVGAAPADAVAVARAIGELSGAAARGRVHPLPVADEPDNPFTDRPDRPVRRGAGRAAGGGDRSRHRPHGQLGRHASPTPRPATTWCAAASPSTASRRRRRWRRRPPTSARR